jgi:hypothetical protein
VHDRPILRVKPHVAHRHRCRRNAQRREREQRPRRPEPRRPEHGRQQQRREREHDPAEAEHGRGGGQQPEDGEPGTAGDRLREHDGAARPAGVGVLALGGDDQPAREVDDDAEPAEQRRRGEQQPQAAWAEPADRREPGADACHPPALGAAGDGCGPGDVGVGHATIVGLAATRRQA